MSLITEIKPEQVSLTFSPPNTVALGKTRFHDRKAYCSIERLSVCHYRILVENEGQRFDDYKQYLSLQDTLGHLSQRGYLIIGTLSDRLEFIETENHMPVLTCSKEPEESDEITFYERILRWRH